MELSLRTSIIIHILVSSGLRHPWACLLQFPSYGTDSHPLLFLSFVQADSSVFSISVLRHRKGVFDWCFVIIAMVFIKELCLQLSSIL